MRLFTYLIPFIQGCWNACDGTIQLDILTQIDFFLHRIYFSSWRTCNQEMIEISMITNIHTIARKGGECGDCWCCWWDVDFFFYRWKKMCMKLEFSGFQNLWIPIRRNSGTVPLYTSSLLKTCSKIRKVDPTIFSNFCSF